MTWADFWNTLGDFDWVAIVVGTVVVFVLAWLWYGPIFGSAWRSATGREMSDSMTPEPMAMMKGFLNFFLLNVGVGVFVPAAHVAFGNPPDFETLVMTALVLAFFVVAVPLYSRVIWEGGSMRHWSIDFGFYFIAIALASWVQDLIA